MSTRIRLGLGPTEARKIPGLGWEVTQTGNLPDFHRLMDLLMEVEAAETPLDEAAQKYGAVVEEE